MNVSTWRVAWQTERDWVTKQQPATRPLAFLVVSWLPALLGHDAIQSAAALFPLAAEAHPYFVPQHALLLYLVAPAVAISACILFLSPGLLLSLALDAAQSVGRWVLSALALSLIVVSAAAGIVQGIIQTPLRSHAFIFVVAICALTSFAILVLRSWRGHAVRMPLRGRAAAFTIASMLVVPFGLLIALAPKFYWENFNGDGAHAFEAARLLLFGGLPFWPASAGDVASFPGITSMLFAYPASWFIRLFGEFEVSARLPFLLYLAVLFGTLVELSTAGRASRPPLGIIEQSLVWLGLIVYAVVMAFSATYSPYAADIALPATQDTLLMVSFLGFVWAFVGRQTGWLLLFVGLTFVSLPSGLLLLGLWLLTVLLAWRPVPWRRIALSAAAIAVSLSVSALAPSVLAALGQPSPGREYGVLGVLRWLAFLQWTDWQRIAFLALPCGVLPALALFAWRRQDRVARSLTLVTTVYFLFFYAQGYTVLHHFVPVMILPLAVFWHTNLAPSEPSRANLLVATGAAGLVALLLSLPSNFTPDTSARRVGSAIDDRIGGYETADPAVFFRSTMLTHLFPYDWDPRVPDQSYGGSPLSWNYYAHQPKQEGVVANYVLQPAADPAPPAMQLVAEEGTVALYVRDVGEWADHRALKPPTPAGSPAYTIPRGMIFRSVPLIEGPTIFSVLDIVTGLGFDVEGLLDRMGVAH